MLLNKQNCLLSILLLSVSCMHSPGLRSEAPATAQQGKMQEPVVQSPAPVSSEGETSGVLAPDQAAQLEESAASFPPAYQPPLLEAKAIKVTDRVNKESHRRQDIFYVPEYGEPYVKHWEDYFTGRGRPSMERYLQRLPRYEGLMKQILKEEGVPPELIYIALIESGFNSTAYSRASAVGYWQFIRGTGRTYGLKQNWLVDERRDPIYSTRAAAQYFKALYHAFGSWHLAMSSYNAGEHRVLRAIMGNVTREFWDLHAKKQLPRETRNYVPKFIAAAKIASNPAKYGFNHQEGHEPFSFETVEVNKGVDLHKFAKGLGVPFKEIKRLNPTFRTGFAPVYKSSTLKLRVPVGKGSAFGLQAARNSFSTRKYVASHGRGYHRVRRGDSLYRIARRYKTSVRTLKRINGLSRRSVIYPGMKIKLPGSYAPRRVKAAKSYAKGSTYRVRRGDSLWTIARRFGVSVSSLKKINNLRSSSLRAGQVLQVKAGGGASRTPSGQKKSHYVRRGDNLTKIARRYGVSLSKLIRHNNLKASSALKIGSRISIPR